jgi:hypothetical protein
MKLGHEQATVLALLMVIVVLRLVSSGRLAAGWTALWGGAHAAGSSGAAGAGEGTGQEYTTNPRNTSPALGAGTGASHAGEAPGAAGHTGGYPVYIPGLGYVG